MTSLYLDQSQCHQFGVPYFEAGTLSVAADTLLKSKRMGYDSEHVAFLKEADEDTLCLVRAEADDPGWYKVTRTIPSWKRPKAVRDAFKAAQGLA